MAALLARSSLFVRSFVQDIRDATRDWRLFRAICEVFLTKHDIEKIVKFSNYDEGSLSIVRIDKKLFAQTCRERVVGAAFN